LVSLRSDDDQLASGAADLELALVVLLQPDEAFPEG
jgi:hypothetical protein